MKDNSLNEVYDPEGGCKRDQNNIIVRKLEIEIKKSADLSKEELEKKTKDNLILFSFKNEPRFPKMGDDIKNDAYILDYQHACMGTEPTFMPELFHLVYRKLLSKKARHPFDYVIMSEICIKGMIPHELMRAYISCLPDHISTSELQGKALMDRFWDALSILKDNNYDNVPSESRPLPKKENESWLF